MQKANNYSPKTWQPTVREPGPAGLGPLSRKPPRGQENTTPVFMLILIHSTYHPLKKWSGMHILSDTTIVSIGVAGCQFSSDGVTSQVSLGTQWVNRWNSFGLMCRGSDIDWLHGQVLLFLFSKITSSAQLPRRAEFVYVSVRPLSRSFPGLSSPFPLGVVWQQIPCLSQISITARQSLWAFWTLPVLIATLDTCTPEKWCQKRISEIRPKRRRGGSCAGGGYPSNP